MKDRKADHSIWNDVVGAVHGVGVVGYEARSRRASTASHARAQTRDVELASLFSGIDRRRKSRTDVTQVFPGGWKTSREAVPAPDVRTPPARTADAGPTPSAAPATASGSPTATTRGTGTATSPALRSGAPGTVLSVTRVGGTVAMLQLAKPAGLTFRAGQHMKISVPGGGRNPYSIASAPSDPTLDLCVERMPGGRVSTQLYALEPGGRVELESQPKGSFVLQPKAAVQLMLATVTGVAPFRSMLREAAAQNSFASYFVLLHGASFADELPYRSELEALAQRYPQSLRYLPSVSRPGDLRNRNFQGLTGRLTDLAPSLARELQASRPGQAIQVYACGHPDMVSTATTTLGSMGFSVTSEVFD